MISESTLLRLVSARANWTEQSISWLYSKFDSMNDTLYVILFYFIFCITFTDHIILSYINKCERSRYKQVHIHPHMHITINHDSIKNIYKS